MAAFLSFVHSGVQCAVLFISNGPGVLTERSVALLTAGVPGAVVSNWVQLKASLSALSRPALALFLQHMHQGLGF